MIALQTWETVSAPPVLLALGCLNLVLPSHDSAAVTAPSHDRAIAAAASQDSAVVAASLRDRDVTAATLRDIAVVAADVGAPATRAAADRLQPSATVGWMSMDDNTGKFFIQFLLTKNHRK